MRCSSKLKSVYNLILIISAAFFLCACGNTNISVPYGSLETNNDFNYEATFSNQEIKLFAQDLCASNSNIVNSSSIGTSNIYAAAVYDVNSKKVLYSYNATTRINPASITKIMTALLVLENCDLNANITVPDVTINESGVQLFRLNEGDVINIKDLLSVMMIYSGNDCALAFAKYIAGTEEAFCELMNQRAESLGCSGTHFSNSMGITAEDHYTTAYDLYLIFNECVKHQEFIDIINSSEYTCSYTTASGEFTTRTVTTTNKFLTGEYTSPNTVTIVGGKTGTTNAAGKCIMLYSLNASGNPYISVIMGAEDEQKLYTAMSLLCNEAIN